MDGDNGETKEIIGRVKRADLGEDSEGLWIQDVNVVALCANHKAADGILICHVLLQCRNAGDNSLKRDAYRLECLCVCMHNLE